MTTKSCWSGALTLTSFFCNEQHTNEHQSEHVLFTSEMKNIVSETSEAGVYKEVYVYLRGCLLYKAWFENGKKTSSRVFHAGEGLTSLLNRKFGFNE